jgi:hypothetical protein
MSTESKYIADTTSAHDNIGDDSSVKRHKSDSAITMVDKFAIRSMFDKQAKKSTGDFILSLAGMKMRIVSPPGYVFQSDMVDGELILKFAQEKRDCKLVLGEPKRWSPACDWPVQMIVISGKFGAGKDYMRDLTSKLLIEEGISSASISHADHFKVDVCSKDGVDYDKVFGNSRDDKTRELLQNRGCRDGRDVYGEDIWLLTSDTWIKVHMSRGVEIIKNADTRFKNELRWARSKPSFIIRLKAPKRTWDRAMKEAGGDEVKARKICSHQSEVELDDVPESEYDLTVENDYGQEASATAQVTDAIRSVLAHRKRVLGASSSVATAST